ncbi:MAG TPA: response regulator, partial [Pseudoxanthomonas sp.]|nr:response regulator [Pseudoxanthomonas sp.]
MSGTDTSIEVEHRGGALDFMEGGGEMGALMRAKDWTATPLGPPEGWPASLKMAVRIMLASSQPIWIGWGPELIYLYNDPYKAIIGGKHPHALGRPAQEVWREIWPDIEPLLEAPRRGGQGTYVESQLLIMERNGYPEETYYTFSYSPIPDDAGGVGGIFCANSDDTQAEIGGRQLALLRQLAADTSDARTWQEACGRAAQALAANPRDLPFALLYMLAPDGHALELAACAGIEPGHPAAPARVALDQPCPWPLEDVLRGHQPRLVADIQALFGDGLPCGAWHRPPVQAAALPVLAAGETGHAGVLVAALNPFRLFDADYQGFLGLVAGQIGGAVANAQAYEEERRRAEALAEIDRAKTAFFSNVSHEFRTPLTLMIGPIEDALNDRALALPPAQRERLQTAHRNGLRLLKLVNSLLDFSRIEAGRVDARYEPVDLARLTAELASNFRSATDRAGLYLHIECPPLPQPVHVDCDMWEKIVLNLLSNAFKFTFEGGIAVRLSVAADGRAAELVVQDTGVGIPAEELPRLFERFHRVEGQKGRSFEGSGIGLALVQELVKLHGGAIRVESRPGEGSAFTVAVPLGHAHLPAERLAAGRERTTASMRAEAYVEEALRWLPSSGDDMALMRTHDLREAGPQGAAAGARILVVDDNADMRDYIRRLLGTRWEVEAAADGLEALDAIRAHRPDLVLSDVMMPALDGFGLLRELRADPALRDLPVILLSARAGEEARVEGLDAGADDYLVKPFSARELVARINANLELARVRQEATRSLRESEARFRNMADNAPVMMWIADTEGGFTYLNRGWLQFTGQALEDALGRGAWDALHPDDRDASEQALREACAQRAAFRAEYRLRRADGCYRWALAAAAPRLAEDGAFLGHIGSVIDITERKEAEQVLQRVNETLEQRVAAAIAERMEAEAQLRHAQKMEAIGKLTGGVAHDFNNVLQVIGGNLQLLLKDVAGDPRAERRLQTALTGIQRGSKLASQLLAFGRRQPLAPKVVNLGRLVRGVDDMLRRALGEGIEIETVVAGGLWNTFVDTVQVENALLNLAINARDAMRGNGRLTIEAGNAFLDDAYALRHPDVAAGQYVMLAVSDTGCGIPPEILDQVFEPFFTTKPEGMGTGLGLSMVYGFVKQSGGHIKIYSEPGHGTTVRLYLPRARAEEDVETVVDGGPVTGGTETVLVVEDDEDVRATVVEMLTDLGYRVLKAKDARSALAIVESGMPIDLLFTDVVMPGPMRSPELARRARERLPDVAVLFTSGYTENAIVHDGRLDDGIDLLSKPYTREALARKLRHVLRNQRQRAAAERPPGPPPAAAPQRRLSVLLVEDDPMIRFSTADMLDALGHAVLEAGDGSQALERLGSGDAMDVLVVDVGLPDVDGVALAAQALQRRPGLHVVFASGHETLPAARDHALLRRAPVLRKPYDMRALEEALRAATAAGPG